MFEEALINNKDHHH